VAYFLLGNQQDGRIGPQEAPTIIGTLLTVAEPLLLKAMVLSNTTASARTYTAHVVASGDTAGATNQVIPGVNIAPNDTLTYEFGPGIPVSGGAAVPANDTIQHVASGAGVNVTAVLSRRNR